MKALLIIVIPSLLQAQHRGFTPAASARQDSVERALLAVPDTQSARVMTHDLARVPHMAGTPAQAATRDYVVDKMKGWGLETWTKSYDVYLPHPDTTAAWLIAPGGKPVALDLREPVVPGDSTSRGPQVIPFNGSTGIGDVTGEVVYVGYGLIEDYQTLDSMGVSVKGKIAIARYGRSFRGIKAREAEKHGALALILYSDPADDGYDRGDVYPRGPMRPAGGIQRGSVENMDGDPSTPDRPSITGAKRVPEDSLAVPHIPVIPMSYGNAEKFLGVLGGPSVPQSWQGGLAFRYHLGAGPVRARIKVRAERGAKAIHTIWDTFGMIRGAQYPDQWVIVGGHRDAWGPGAADDISGTVTVLEAAHAFAALAKQGIRPARTLIFATWDAEEWGLVGSTEWVEEMEDSLQAHAVAYINEDDMTSGTAFNGGGSPSLKALITSATRAVPAPDGHGSVYDAWLASHTGDTTALTLGNLGGGSDFAGFYHHLGIPAGAIGFGGPSGIYHSLYDDYEWMTRFGDPGYREHLAAARLVSVIVSRLANADVAPLDYVGFSTEMTALVRELDAGIAKKHWTVSTQPVKDALGRFADAARTFVIERDSTLGAGIDAPRAARVTEALMQVERRLTRPQGLVYGGHWFRSLQFASDVDNGYATLAYPTVNEAIRYGDEQTTGREIADLVARIDAARSALVQALAALR